MIEETEVPIIPEVPKLVDNEIFYVYIPKGSADAPGIFKVSLDDFNVSEDGKLSLKKDYLEKVKEGSNRLYGIDANGNQITVPFDANNTANSMVMRNGEGFVNISVSEPINDTDPTNKQYVDDELRAIPVYTEDTLPQEPPSSYFLVTDGLISAFVNGVEIVRISNGIGAANASGDTTYLNGDDFEKLKQFTENGKGKAVTPIEDDDIANKKYVDDSLKNNASVEYGNKTYANALVGNESGEIISMDDVSPLEHKISVKVRSKNLLPYPYLNSTTTINGIDFTDNGDGTITANGTATANVLYYLSTEELQTTKPFIIGETYTVSGCPSGSSALTYEMQCGMGTGSLNCYDSGLTLVARKNTCTILIIIRKDVTVSNLVFKPQIELGTTATPYTPYVPDGTEVTVKSCGKNLFDISQDYFNKHYAVTVEKNDKSIILSQVGTLSSTPAYFALPNNLAGKKITISCDVFTSGVNSARLRIHWADKVSGGVGGDYLISDVYSGQTTKKLVLTGVVPNQPDASHNQLSLLLYAQGTSSAGLESEVTYTTTYSNIQIEIGDTATLYEPYIEGETVPTTVGETAELTSIAPNMTITTDNSGAVVEVNYTKDTNKVIEKLVQAIISLGGNI